MIELAREEALQGQHISVASIKVVGVGGAGGNTINRMVQSDYKGIEFYAINTDSQALQLSKADHVIQIGQKSTKGLGAGANPEIGKRAAEEDLDKVIAALEGADIVFLTAGGGGGTGSGALPVIAKALKEKNILTIVVVTRPFDFEGRKRAASADKAIEEVKKYADTLLVVPNQKLLEVVDDKVSMIQGFEMINEVLNQSVKGVSDIITRAGHINVDFADVREIMKDKGLAVMGTGRASGPDRARKAAIAAISSPLLENMSIAGVRGVLLNISGNAGLGLHEISAAASVIYDQVDADANIILGSVIDDSLGDEVAVTVIATGFTGKTAELKIQGTTLVKEIPAGAMPLPEKEVIVQAAPQPVVEAIAPHVEKVQYVAQPQPVVAQQVAPVACHIQVPLEAAPVVHTNNQEAFQEDESEEEVMHFERHQTNELGSNIIHLKDLDVPTFMRKQQAAQQPQVQRHTETQSQNQQTQQAQQPQPNNHFQGNFYKKHNKKNKHRFGNQSNQQGRGPQ